VIVSKVGVTWLKTWGGGHNRPGVLGTLIYEGVKLENGGICLNWSLIYIHPFPPL